MSENNLQVLLLTGIYKCGEPYPEIDFSEVQSHGITNKAKHIACSNEEIKQQIDERLAQNPSENEVPYFFYKVLHNNGLGKTNINPDTGDHKDAFGNRWKDHVDRIAKKAKERKEHPIMLNKDVDLQKLMSEKVEYTAPDVVVQNYVSDLYEKGFIDKNGKYILRDIEDKQQK